MIRLKYISDFVEREEKVKWEMLSFLYNLCYILPFAFVGSEWVKILRYKMSIIGIISADAWELRNQKNDTRHRH